MKHRLINLGTLLGAIYDGAMVEVKNYDGSVLTPVESAYFLRKRMKKELFKMKVYSITYDCCFPDQRERIDYICVKVIDASLVK